MKKLGIISSFVILVSLFYSWRAFPTNLPEQYQLSRIRDKIFAFHVSDEHTYWAVGSLGLILKTTDGGETWMKIEPPTGDKHDLTGVTFVGNYGWVVGNSGLILHSGDGGSHWKKQVSNSENNLMQVFFLDKKRGVAVGEQGTILWTEDGGSIWQASPLDWSKLLPESLLEKGVLSPNLYEVFFVDEAHGWIAGDAGVVLFSADVGKTWHLIQVGVFPPLYSLFFKDDSEGWAVGQGGLIIYTEDGGKTWRKQDSTVQTNLFKIRFFKNSGVVVGNLGTILQTTNEGTTWNVVDVGLKPPLPWFLDVDFISHNPPEEVMCTGQGFMKVSLRNEEKEKSK